LFTNNKYRRNSNVKLTTNQAISAIRAKTGVKEGDEWCVVQLSETPTQIQFCLSSFTSASDTRDIKEVEERNARYEQVIESHKNADNYISHPTQTMNHPLKNQNEMAAPNASQVSSSIYLYHYLINNIRISIVKRQLTTSSMS
jgi:hypothetical protein